MTNPCIDLVEKHILLTFLTWIGFLHCGQSGRLFDKLKINIETGKKLFDTVLSFGIKKVNFPVSLVKITQSILALQIFTLNNFCQHRGARSQHKKRLSNFNTPTRKENT